MSSELGFLITAYQQVNLVEQNILRIRNEYKHFNKSQIVIVSTSEEDPGFVKLEQLYDNIKFVHFSDAPGNPSNTTYKSKPQEYANWRLEYLPPRILMSIGLGLGFMEADTCLHLHSDTYWLPEKENNLVNEMNALLSNDYLFIGDVDLACDTTCVLPPNLHFHPEGLLLNLDECQRTGYGYTFSEIFSEYTEFKSHNYNAIEAMIGQYAVWCLSRINVLNNQIILPRIYNEKVKVRMRRHYHGIFESGLVNIPGYQA